MPQGADTVTGAAAPSADAVVMQILMTPEGRADPYPHYEQLRSAGPLHRSQFGPVWFLTGYDDCNFVLRDPRFGKGDPEDERSVLFAPPFRPERRAVLLESMLFKNPPDHTRLRGLVSRAFANRALHGLEQGIAELTDSMLDTLPIGEEVDLISSLAFRLPVQVIGELVGVPAEDREGFRSIVAETSATLDGGVDEARYRAAEASMAEMEDYFRDLVVARRKAPREDLVSHLISARDGEDKLSEDELIATLVLLFAAGFETTTNLIGNGTLCLLRSPDQLARLRQGPDLVPSAVEEMLRFESPVQLDARAAFESLEMHGQTIEADDIVVTFLGAANRDPGEFESPERFDVARQPNHPLSFAAGIHHCIGAGLSRMEGRIVFTKLLERFAHIELVEDPPWRPTFVLRGLSELKVRLVVS